MAPRLTPCSSCQRLIHADEQACPFCAAPLGKSPTGRAALAGAVVLTAALSLGGKCGEPEVAAAYGAAPTTASAPATSAGLISTAAPAYGLAPTAAPTALVTPTASASSAASAAPSSSSSATPQASTSAKTKAPPTPTGNVAVPAYGLPPTAPKPSR